MIYLYRNIYTKCEDELVKSFIRIMSSEKSIMLSGCDYTPIMYEQISIPGISRFSDLILKAGNRLINIEFKLDDLDCVIKQAKDHTKWADYSYICLPITTLQRLTDYHMREIIINKIGIIAGNEQTFFTVYKAYYHSYKNGKSKYLRKYVEKKLDKLEK